MDAVVAEPRKTEDDDNKIITFFYQLAIKILFIQKKTITLNLLRNISPSTVWIWKLCLSPFFRMTSLKAEKRKRAIVRSAKKSNTPPRVYQYQYAERSRTICTTERKA